LSGETSFRPGSFIQLKKGENFMPVPIVTIVGVSDSGKTTLIEKLIPRLTALGLKVGSVKHDVHGFEMDRAGKDSWRHKHAGASTTVISSPRQVGMVKDVVEELTLDQIAERYLSDVDIIVVEGYKRQDKPKIEVHRKAQNRDLLSRDSKYLIAVATDEPVDVQAPCFDIEDARGLAGFIACYFAMKKEK
jgi:molybdopterin-guanine dinucleotide biosynthesis adapter protein